MKLYVLSDLHLEFSTFEPSKTDADVVVLAGDIGKGSSGIEWARNEGVRFLGTTLWTDFMLFGEAKKSTAMSDGQLCLNDFRVIREGAGTFTPARSIELHEQSLSWLKAKLDEPFSGKTIVVTHHLPSKQSVVDRFKDDLLSACFASELGYLFGKMDLWVHGHTHDNLDYEANGTRVICNPRGYVTYRGSENLDFNPELVIEI